MHQHSGHTHQPVKGKNLWFSILLNIGITIAQIVGGLLSGSLSLLSDALHNFSDVISLIISYIANKIAGKEASFNKTFGYKRAEIIAAFVNALSLIVIAIILIKEAIFRFFDPQPIQSNMVIWLAILAIAGNGLSVLLMKKDSKTNMNMRSAYLHLLTDMLASVAVLIGGLLMKFYQIYWIDSLLTAAIAIYLIYVGWDLLRDSFKILMLFTPHQIPLKNIATKVCEIEEVKNMHHIHVWQLNENEVHLEAHIDFKKNITLSEFDEILVKIEHEINHFGINHINIQPEFNKPDNKAIIVQD
ncbi:cation diffusion facilitator family transporter [Mesonia aestuariivivens]|uniref:Cation diffusion facilitator family transporter n=1 Tax=Mesonia aestuariivivens TaxID=2796128 RepID=A0ABS6W171_9FLAO|nr:cation diffusion facilitator family transporter [Mesonia aestuariivivens]MBW2961569.1 cation diffusion facilitator family transporter [Mesonia aestuariivivens]